MAEIPARRAGDAPIYTQSDLDRIRERDRDDVRYGALAGQVGELRGALSRLPGDMEATARRVFGEQMAELRKERGDRTWRTADTLIALGQVVIAGLVAVLALK